MATAQQYGGLYSTQRLGAGAGMADPSKVPQGYYFISPQGYRVNAYGMPVDDQGNMTSVANAAKGVGPANTGPATAAAPAGTVSPGQPGWAGQAPQISMGTGAAGGAAGAGGNSMATTPQTQPETVALQQMAQIDPASEQLRQAVAGSYLTSLGQAQTPTAQQFQSYLNLAGQVDPTSAAARAKLGQDLASQEALGTQLDPATLRQVQQATREAQIARGNVYGTPQLVQEAMTTGQAGLALQQQRQAALQGYLTSGQTPGDVAMNLYNQQQNQLRANQGAALSYLGSGSTPYQAGSSYVQLANQNAAAAAQGGPQYNPTALGQQYTGTGAPSFPQYGLDMSQLAGNWYNNINAANLQAYGLTPQNTQGSQLAKAGAGALSGAATGALGGAAVGGIGAIPGAIIGGIGGAASGYFG